MAASVISVTPRRPAGAVPPAVASVVLLRSLAALLPLLALAGCFQLRALIRVADDGSGTIAESVMMGGMMIQMMHAGDSTGAPALYDIDSLRAHAARLGEGVTLLRVDSIADGEEVGYRAVYAFRDVGDVRFRFNPNPVPRGGGGRAGRGSGAMLAGTAPGLEVTFDRAPDGSLVIRMPRSHTDRPPPTVDRQEVATLADSLRRQMHASGEAVSGVLDGMRLSLEVAGPHPVAATDASFRGDSSVVLFDYTLGSFASLMREKPELVARAQLEERAGWSDPRPIVRALAGQPNVRYELLPEVNVIFGR